jgi:hypothetical protein
MGGSGTTSSAVLLLLFAAVSQYQTSEEENIIAHLSTCFSTGLVQYKDFCNGDGGIDAHFSGMGGSGTLRGLWCFYLILRVSISLTHPKACNITRISYTPIDPGCQKAKCIPGLVQYKDFCNGDGGIDAHFSGMGGSGTLRAYTPIDPGCQKATCNHNPRRVPDPPMPEKCASIPSRSTADEVIETALMFMRRSVYLVSYNTRIFAMETHRPWMSKGYLQPQPPKGPGSTHAREMCINSAISSGNIACFGMC